MLARDNHSGSFHTDTLFRPQPHTTLMIDDYPPIPPTTASTWSDLHLSSWYDWLTLFLCSAMTQWTCRIIHICICTVSVTSGMGSGMPVTKYITLPTQYQHVFYTIIFQFWLIGVHYWTHKALWNNNNQSHHQSHGIDLLTLHPPLEYTIGSYQSIWTYGSNIPLCNFWNGVKECINWFSHMI